MNSDDQIPMPEGSPNTAHADDSVSVDDFIRELEEKEKDLMIAADMQIEIEEDGDDDDVVPDFVLSELSTAAAPQAPAPATRARNFQLENEIAALKVRVLELKAERNDIQEKSDRRLKDFENFKYRMDREKRGSFIDQIANLAGQMLPALDNLERAIDSADHLDGEKSPDFQQFFNGILLVVQQINDVLAGMGVQPISTVGEPFDPNFHEAVAAEISSELPPNTISQEVLRGYRIGNKVIRHSMVKVTSRPAAPVPSAAPPSELPIQKPSLSDDI